MRDGKMENDNDSDDEWSKDVRITLSFIRTIEAEKRTHLAELRTGIGILTIPLSLLTILIATSNYYEPLTVLPYIMSLILGIFGLSVVGTYLLVRSLRSIRACEKLLDETSMDTATLARHHANQS